MTKTYTITKVSRIEVSEEEYLKDLRERIVWREKEIEAIFQRTDKRILKLRKEIENIKKKIEEVRK